MHRSVQILTRIAVFTSVLVWACGPLVAAPARDHASPTSTVAAQAGFQGTGEEFVAFVLQHRLEQAGFALKLADPRVAAELKAKSGGSDEFLWARSLVLQASSRTAVSFTPAASLQGQTDGLLTLGVLKNGTVDRALRVQVDPTETALGLKVMQPDGAPLGQFYLPIDKNGKPSVDQTQARQLGQILGSENLSGGLGIIELVLDILYQIAAVIDVADCIVSAAINLFNTYAACGWGNMTPGGGAVINLFICSIDATISFIDRVVNGCL